MNSLTAYLESICRTGETLLEKLKYSEPDLAEIEDLYRTRAEKIDFLEKKFKFSPELADKQKHEVKRLFEKLMRLEKELKGRLQSLKKSRLQSLKETGRHGKAKDRYRSGSSGGRSARSRFIDLKTKG